MPADKHNMESPVESALKQARTGSSPPQEPQPVLVHSPGAAASSADNDTATKQALVQRRPAEATDQPLKAEAL
eukprot:2067711-Pyramimonas_sp.AAC.1